MEKTECDGYSDTDLFIQSVELWKPRWGTPYPERGVQGTEMGKSGNLKENKVLKTNLFKLPFINISKSSPTPFLDNNTAGNGK